MNLNNIDLNKIRIFHAVVQGGSYAQAAQEVGLTRSAISQAMTTLEGQIGAPLFLRKGRKLFPTKEAVALAQSFELWQKNLCQVLGRVTGTENSGEGLVRIGSYYEFARTTLSKKIKDFSTEFPQSRFRLSFDSPSRLQHLLVSGKLDMCFSIFPHEGSQDIESLPIFEQELVLVAPKAWKVLCRRAEDITAWPIVEYYKSHQLLPRWLKSHFGKKNSRLDPQIFAASAEMLLGLVKLEMGLGVVPKYLVTDSDLKMVQLIEPSTEPLTDFIWLNQYIGQFENSAHREFYNFMK